MTEYNIKMKDNQNNEMKSARRGVNQSIILGNKKIAYGG